MIKQCLVCNKDFITYPSFINKGYGKFCSRKCFFISYKGHISWNKGKKGMVHSGSFKPREKHPMWKGGKSRDNNGYIRIHNPEHPFAHRRDSYVLEHRLVMEKMLNRLLTKNEIVHHKNGIRDDNRPENLILATLNKHWHPCLCPKCGFDFLVK